MKLYITVGTQMPFDRMIEAVDLWLFNNPGVKAFAQVGPGGFQPKNMDWTKFIEPTEFIKQVIKSDVLVAHAGMGSIITALQYGTPIVIIPRQEKLGEHRNNHQLATASRFTDFEGIRVANDEIELPGVLDKIIDIPSSQPISKYASDELIKAVSGFINSD